MIHRLVEVTHSNHFLYRLGILQAPYMDVVLTYVTAIESQFISIYTCLFTCLYTYVYINTPWAGRRNKSDRTEMKTNHKNTMNMVICEDRTEKNTQSHVCPEHNLDECPATSASWNQWRSTPLILFSKQR